jgi:hypothetical protein
VRPPPSAGGADPCLHGISRRRPWKISRLRCTGLRWPCPGLRQCTHEPDAVRLLAALLRKRPELLRGNERQRNDAMGQIRTHTTQQAGSSLDHFVGATEQPEGNHKAK